MLADRAARDPGRPSLECDRVVPGYTEVDDRDAPLPPGQVGEIVYGSHEPYTMMLGYYRNPDATLEARRNLGFHSGDLGSLDEDGYLHFVDRKKDSMRRRGENISSYEVEKVVNDHPAVLESAAVGVPAELGEDEVKIVVVLRPGEALRPEALVAWCERRVPNFMVPRYVEFLMPSGPSTPPLVLSPGGLVGAPADPAGWLRAASTWRQRHRDGCGGRVPPRWATGASGGQPGAQESSSLPSLPNRTAY